MADLGYTQDFYITSTDEDWVATTAEMLEERDLSGVYEKRDMLGGPKTINIQNFIKSSRVVIFGFDKYNKNEEFQALLVLQDMFDKNDRSLNKLIVVKLTEHSEVPSFLNIYHPLEARMEDFNDKVVRSIKMQIKEMKRKEKNGTSTDQSLALGIEEMTIASK
ncbi:uncharacterized protein LOC144359189 [Saccoglossus kowalevskii]